MFFKILLKIFTRKKLEILKLEEKKYTEEEVFFYAKKRLADVFHLKVSEVALDDIVGEGKLLVRPPSLLKSNELDILNEDMFCASWNYTQASVLKKMYPNENKETLMTVKEYCDYMVCCYRYCTKKSYKSIIDILNLEK